MTPERYQRIKSIFFDAAGEQGPARAALLERACGPDSELRDEVEKLLADQDSATRDIQAFVSRDDLASIHRAIENYAGAAGSSAAPTAQWGSVKDVLPQVPGYTTERLIRAGGMGAVYAAQQQKPRRTVAIKVMRPGTASRTALRRFEFEAQALAHLRHPAIAQVFESGTFHSHGVELPFFVMEYIPDAVSITEYAERRQLTARARLELFSTTCEAVHAGHQKGIIHRDIKPSNVLVDAGGAVKLIDFGVARTIDNDAAQATMQTHAGHLIGTPAYMSPEQADGSADIDTRTDVYALGVLLYELLTGLTPFHSRNQAATPLQELLRQIREVDPPKPSDVVTVAGSGVDADLRPSDLRKLRSTIQGELDWITMRALEKDRTRRYQSAREFAADIERFLKGEAVVAARPSLGYKLGKFVKRHRAQVIAASLVVAALLVGFAGTAWGLVEANRARLAERKRADGERDAKLNAQEKERIANAAAERERAARQEEERQRKFAEAIGEFVRDDFLALTSVEGQDRFGGEGKEALSKDTTLKTLLDRAAEKLRARTDLDPLVEAELCWIVGVSYRGEGEARKGIVFLERATQIRGDVLGRDHEATLNAMNSLAVAYLAAGKIEPALRLHDETLRRTEAKYGRNHPSTLWSMNNYAEALSMAGKDDLAVALHAETLELRKANLGPDHPDTLASMNNLAVAYRGAGKVELALPLLEEAARLLKDKLGPDHRATLGSMNNLAAAYRAAGMVDRAVALHEDTLKLQRARLGDDHPSALISMHNLALAYKAAGKGDMALAMLEEARDLEIVKIGPDHPDTLTTMNDLADLYRQAGKLGQAVRLLKDTLKRRKAVLGPDHASTILTMNNLAAAYRELGKTDLAMPLWKETLKHAKASLGVDHPDTLSSMHNLALAYQAAGQLDLAIPLMEEALEGRKRRLGRDAPDTLLSMNNLAGAYGAAGKSDLALPIWGETYRLTKARLGPDHPETLASMSNFAAANWIAKQLDQSIPLFEETLRRRVATLGRDHVDTLMTIANLGVNYKDAGRYADAIALLEEAHMAAKAHPSLAWVGQPLLEACAKGGDNEKLIYLIKEMLTEARDAPADDPDRAEKLAGILAQVGMNLLQQKKWAESEPLLRECLAIREKEVPDDWKTFNTRSMLGGALLGQNRLAEAEPLLIEGHRGMNERKATIPPEGQPRMHEAIERLVRLHEAKGDAAEAAAWQSRLEAARAAPAKPSDDDGE